MVLGLQLAMAGVHCGASTVSTVIPTVELNLLRYSIARIAQNALFRLDCHSIESKLE